MLPADPRPVTLYVGGTSRSGSTLLECLLARLDGVVVLGEVAHLWRRGLLADELCACGEHFSRCPFWQAVGDRAFGGWPAVDVQRVLELKDAVDRQRKLPSTGRRRPTAAVASAATEYAAHYRAIYDAAADIAGAQVVVDSSKVPPTATALTHDPAIDLRIIHIVRDSRGVAYSWTRTVRRPESLTGESMPRFNVGSSAVQWVAHNLQMGFAAHRGADLARLRYEDLVDDAGGAVRDVWQRLGLPGDGTLPMIDSRTIELRPTHSVAGNPMRFRHGATTLSPDVAWRSDMPAHQRRLVTAVTFPLLMRFGYAR
jgi:hypothetical protein